MLFVLFEDDSERREFVVRLSHGIVLKATEVALHYCERQSVAAAIDRHITAAVQGK
jgi:hypothetical protein